ncbi:GNAT family N-acetyltransferase [Sagittula salina]|uniref:GNAT family N-acetyltransferase n=1 Tax=Sagittula salina TaxID=2820268 RepID=A0A940ML77_9RHOB|nr:GNAT family N-acetyltransferase [Sagittula salina]MBP0483551.1 GNAT family N-acetyltransferase [Sagittula salina]
MTSSLTIRAATIADIDTLVALYADDALGQTRDGRPGTDDAYRAAFDAIDGDPNHILAVGELEGRVVATLLLSFLPGLSRGGSWRAQIEAMRVASDHRGGGLGRAMLDWSIEQARARGCALVQLTSDRQRPDAHRFYERAGFTPSHYGFKLSL